MTELMTPATLLGPMWFSGSIERGRLSLHQGHVWFEPGTLVQREPGHLWFQHHPTSKNDIVVPVERSGPRLHGLRGAADCDSTLSQMGTTTSTDSGSARCATWPGGR